MRELTDSELKTRDRGWLEYLGNAGPEAVDEFDVFEYGFTTALDHQLAQVAGLEAENTRLREKLFKAAKSLKRIIKGWRNYAAGDYCQTYNREMGKGLSRAADDLERYVNDAYRGEE